MTIDRRTALIVGILFIIGTVAGILSAVFTVPILDAPDYLVQIAANENQIIIGALLVLIMGLALAMIPVMMFPIFKRYDEALALGAVVFRGPLEAALYVAIAISWLSLITLSRGYVEAASPDASHIQALGALLVEGVDWISQILAIVFSLGALMTYCLFYQSRLIPRWLALWGLVGAVLYLAVPLLNLFGIDFGILMAPLALQEMVLAVWLIVKGFSSSPITPNLPEGISVLAPISTQMP